MCGRLPTTRRVSIERADRLRALDGLRGVAALAVLLFHVVMAGVPTLGAVSAISGSAPGLIGRLAHSPVAVLWAGPQFVIVFFVLSGFVLTRATRDRPMDVPSYYAARL